MKVIIIFWYFYEVYYLGNLVLNICIVYSVWIGIVFIEVKLFLFYYIINVSWL